MLDPNSANIVINQAMASAAAVWLIQKAKAASWFPLVNAGATMAVRMFSALVAALSVAGIFVTANWSGAEHTFQLTVAGLTMQNVTAFLWTSLRGFMEQEVLRRITK